MPKNRRLISKSITHQDIAHRCGLSRSTVSRALLDDPTVREETRVRVQQVAREMGYNAAAQESARRLVLRQYGKVPAHYVIAVLMAPDSCLSRYDARVFSGIWQEAYARGYALVTTYLKDGADTQLALRFPPVLARADVDGIIITNLPPQYINPLLQAFIQDNTIGGMPLVCLFSYEPTEIIAVIPDYFQVGYQTGRHLLALGHRHVLHFTYTAERSPTDERLAGMAAAYREMRLDARPYLHPFPLYDLITNPHLITAYLTEHATTPEQARRHPLVAYVLEHPEVTAVVGINDATAINACCLFETAGFRVPEDISVIGCDDTDPMSGPKMANRLTTVRLPLEEIGRLAVRRVIAQAEQGEVASEQVVLPVELIPRATSGPARMG